MISRWMVSCLEKMKDMLELKECMTMLLVQCAWNQMAQPKWIHSLEHFSLSVVIFSFRLLQNTLRTRILCLIITLGWTFCNCVLPYCECNRAYTHLWVSLLRSGPGDVDYAYSIKLRRVTRELKALSLKVAIAHALGKGMHALGKGMH